MPIEALTVDALRVKNLHVGTDGRGRFLSCNCSIAEAYVLCFSSGELRTRSNLSLTEEELSALYDGSLLEKDGCRLQGVPSRVMAAASSFRSFQVYPPEQIQVWSMTKRPDGHAILYVPDVPGKEVCHIPLHFKTSCTQGTISCLTIQMGAEDLPKYQDGALLYCVGKSRPIPVPKACLNTPISIRSDNQPVRVVVGDAFEGKYQEI